MKKKHTLFNPDNKQAFISVLSDLLKDPKLNVKTGNPVIPVQEYTVNFIESETKARGLKSGTAVFNSKLALIRKIKKAKVVDEVLYAISEALLKVGGTSK